MWRKVGKSGEKLEKVAKSWKKWRKVGKRGEKCGKRCKKYEIVVKSWKKWPKVGKSKEKLEKVAKSWKKWWKVGISGESWGKVAKSLKGIFFSKWPPAAILDNQKSLSIAFLAISEQYATFFFWIFFQNGRWPPFWKSLLGQFRWPKITFDRISRHFRSIRNFFLIFFSKWPPAAILEVRFAPKTIGFFHYVLSMAMPNMKLIGEFVTQLEMPQAFWAFLYKMAARGHFVFPIDDKNHRVLVIWDLNGYGEYEFDRCICDKAMACTSIGVRRRRRRRRPRRRRRRNQNHNITEIFKFRGYNYGGYQPP